MKEVCPWTVFAHELGIDLNSPQIGLPRIFKSHENFERIPKGGKYIYVVRNPSDVCVSFYHFLIKFVGLDEADIPLDEFIQKLFVGAGSVSGKIWHHYLSYYNHRLDGNVLFVFYEDLISNLEAVIEQIAGFMCIELDDELRAVTMEQASFSFMKARSSQFDEHLVFHKCKERMGLKATDESRAEKVNRGGGGSSGRSSGEGSEELTAEHHALLEDQWTEVFGAATGVQSYEALWRQLSPLSVGPDMTA